MYIQKYSLGQRVVQISTGKMYHIVAAACNEFNSELIVTYLVSNKPIGPGHEKGFVSTMGEAKLMGVREYGEYLIREAALRLRREGFEIAYKGEIMTPVHLDAYLSVRDKQ